MSPNSPSLVWKVTSFHCDMFVASWFLGDFGFCLTQSPEHQGPSLYSRLAPSGELACYCHRLVFDRNCHSHRGSSQGPPQATHDCLMSVFRCKPSWGIQTQAVNPKHLYEQQQMGSVCVCVWGGVLERVLCVCVHVRVWVCLGVVWLCVFVIIEF